MSCPRCGSNDIWDDNLWWGCNPCGYAAGPDGPTFLFAQDKPGLARNITELKTNNPVRDIARNSSLKDES